jgi:hypothetical protein
MMIVGQVSDAQEAYEMESIAKCLVVGNRARVLAGKIKKED